MSLTNLLCQTYPHPFKTLTPIQYGTQVQLWANTYSAQVLPCAFQLPSPSIQLPSTEAHAIYQSSLAKAADTARHSVSKGQRKKRDNIMAELQQYLQGPMGSMQKSLHNCTPQDIMVFMESHYIQEHAGTEINGTQMAAPGSIENALSALRMGFREIQRCTPWDEVDHQHGVNITGNPAHSRAINQWKTGYSNRAHAAGFKSAGASEMVPDKVQQLLQAIGTEAVQQQDSIQRQLALRDGFAYAMLWATAVRPCNPTSQTQQSQGA